MSFEIRWTDFSEEYDDPKIAEGLSFMPEFKMEPDSDCKTHLFFEGDNYPVLQKLLPLYKNKINLIYIDPPYNTGNNFTYNDKFFKGSTGSSKVNPQSDKHSAWLSFMNRRLLLAEKLLSQSGCIFIAIDQNELYTLKLLCDRLFGKDNFVNDFMWLHGKGKKDTWSRTLQQHTLCYAKNKKYLKAFSDVEYTSWATKNPDKDPRGNWFSGSVSFSEARSNPEHPNFFTITSPSGIKWTRQWQRTREQMNELISQNKIYWGPEPEYNQVPRVKIFNQEPSFIIPKNIIDCVESTRHAQKHLDELLGTGSCFDNPKPVDLITHLIKITCMPENALIMDFFAGSGTTFEAVCRLNKEDGGSRKAILIQKPEVPQKSSAEFSTIADLCWQRLQKNSQDFGQTVRKFTLIEK